MPPADACLGRWHSQVRRTRRCHTPPRSQGLRLGPGEKGLFTQLCLHTAFPRSPQLFGLYLTGEDPNLVDNYPELAYFRDIVFTFKALMAPTCDALPPVQPWAPVDGRLRWRWDAESASFSVTAFRTQLNPVLVQEKAEAQLAAQARPDPDTHGFFRQVLRAPVIGPRPGGWV